MATYEELDYGALFRAVGRQQPQEDADESRGFVRGAADLGLEVASGVTRGVGMLSNAFGANNAVSRGARSADEFIRDYLSAQSKEDSAQAAAILAEAEDQGIGAQVVAGLRAFGQAPLSTLANTVGMAAPVIATALIPGLREASLAARASAMAGVGGAQGAGAVKGAIFEGVKQEQIDGGMSEPEAIARAEEAQSYAGPNTANIAGGAALGGLAGATGFQPAAARAISSVMGRGMLSAETRAVEQGLMRRIGQGAAVEGVTEFAQGGQEAYATNVALQREGFDVPTFRGVVSQGTMEAVAGSALGAGFGALDRRAGMIADIGKADNIDDAIAAAERAANPLLLGNDGPAPMIVFPDGTVGRQEDIERYLQGIPEADRPAARARLLNLAPQTAPATPTVDADDQALADLNASRRAAGIGPYVPPIPVGEASEVLPVGEVSEVKSIPAGEATELDPIPAPDVTEIEDIPTGEVIEGAPERTQRTLPQAPPLIDPTAPNAIAQYIDSLRAVNTPAARAYVKEYEAGRVTQEEVLARMMPRREQTADERLAAAAAEAPGPFDGLLLTSDGMPYGTKTGASMRARKEGGEVIVIPGGWAVRPRGQDAADAAGDGNSGPAVARRGDGGEQLREQRPADVADDARPADAEGVGSVGADGLGAGRTAAPDAALTTLEALADRFSADARPTSKTYASVLRGYADDVRSGKMTPEQVAPQIAAYSDMLDRPAPTLKERLAARQAQAQGTTPPTAPGVESSTAPSAAQPAGGGDTPAASAGVEAAGVVEPERVKIKTRSGSNVYVNKSDLESDKPRMRHFTSTGKSLGIIVRENLDPTGELRAADAKEQADNPLFDVIGNKDGRAFATQAAAARELSMRGLGASHEVVPAGEGFALKKRKAADAAAPAQPAPPQGRAPEVAAPPRVYKTKTAASMARKQAGNTQRLKKIKGGYILRAATDKELAAADRAGKRLASGGGVDVENDSLLTALSKIGGLAMKERSDTIGEGNRNIAGKMLFRMNGKPLDRAIEELIEYGYIPAGEARSDPSRWLREAIKLEYLGTRQYFSDQGTEWMQADERSAESLSDDELADLSAYDLEQSGYNSAPPEVQALTERLLAEAEALGIDTDAIREDAARNTEGLSQTDYELAVQEALTQAIARIAADAEGRDAGPAPAGGRNRSEADGGQEQSSREALTLTAPTREEVVAEQDRRARLAEDEAKAEREAAAAERKAREQREVNDRARQEASADNFQLGQDATDALAGQSSTFDGPAAEAAPEAAPAVNPRPEALIALRKRVSVLKSLKECLA